MTTDLRLPLHRDPVPTRTRLRTRAVPTMGYALVLLLLPVAIVTAAMVGGWWRTTGSTLGSSPAAAARANEAAGTSGTSGTSGTGAGPREIPAAPAQAADVKGSMSLQQVLDAFPAVTAVDVLTAFGVPADTPPTTLLKDLVAAGNGLDVPGFRTWLERHTAPA